MDESYIVAIGLIVVGISVAIVRANPSSFESPSDIDEDVSGWDSLHPHYRCWRHHTRLTDDAIRGLICENCDRENETAVADLWSRFTAWIWKRVTFSD